MWKKRTPLSKLKSKPGEWWASQFFAQVEVAHDWHVRPSTLGICTEDEDVAVMSAYTRTTAAMSAWDNTQSEARNARKAK